MGARTSERQVLALEPTLRLEYPASSFALTADRTRSRPIEMPFIILGDWSRDLLSYHARSLAVKVAVAVITEAAISFVAVQLVGTALPDGDLFGN